MSYKGSNPLCTRVPPVVADQRAFGSESSVTKFTLKVLLVCVNGQVCPQDICLHTQMETKFRVDQCYKGCITAHISNG